MVSVRSKEALKKQDWNQFKIYQSKKKEDKQYYLLGIPVCHSIAVGKKENVYCSLSRYVEPK